MAFTAMTVPLPLFYDEHELYGKGPTSCRRSRLVLTLFHCLQNVQERMHVLKVMSVRLYDIIQEPLGGFGRILICPSTLVIVGQSKLAVFNFMKTLYTQKKCINL